MAFINKHDTNGTKGLLAKGELGYDDYSAGGDTGRVYVGNGASNIALAKKSEVDAKVVANAGIIAGTATKVTYDANGLVTSGTTLSAGDIPVLDAGKITTGTLPVARGGTGVTTVTGAGSVVLNTSPALVTPDIGIAIGTSFNNITGLASVNPIIAGVAAVGTSTLTARQDHVHPVQTSVSGNAGTATKLATARTITLTGDVTGSVNFDGSGNVSITTIVADDSHNHIISNVDGLQYALDSKANQATTYTKEEVSGAVGNIMSPLLDIPLKNNIAMKAGVGSTTFTRASTATYIDRYGVLKTADIDAPRFEKEGYLNEGSSTNLLLHSQGISTSPWVVSSGYTVLSNTTETTDPFGTNLAEKSFPKIGTPSFANSSPYQIVNTVAGNTYTQSVFVKPFGPLCGAVRLHPNDEINPDNYVSVVFYFGNKAMGISSSSGNWTQPIASFEELANGWFRVSVTFTTGTATQVRCRIFPYTSDPKSFTGDGDSGLYIFGAQLEALPFATSYIPTTSSTVTRSADVLQVTRENNFPNAENNKEGYSVAFAYDTLGTLPTANQFLWSLYVDGQNYDSGFLTIATNSLRNLIAKAGATVNNLTVPVNLLGSNKVVQTQSNTFLKQYINGTLDDTNVNTLGTLGGGVNSLTNITVGGISGLVTTNLFGHISDFKVYDRELTPVEVALL